MRKSTVDYFLAHTVRYMTSQTTVSRTHERIALGPTGNLQGSVKFYCLNTGKVLKRRAFTEIPMPTAVIAKADKIGKKDNQGK